MYSKGNLLYLHAVARCLLATTLYSIDTFHPVVFFSVNTTAENQAVLQLIVLNCNSISGKKISQKCADWLLPQQCHHVIQLCECLKDLRIN